MQLSVVLLAGGSGKRMNSATPKQFLPLRGKPIISYSYEFFCTLSYISEIIVVCHEDYRDFFPLPSHLPVRFALPGKERQDSVENGVKELRSKEGLVCIHDGARPFISFLNMDNLIKEAFAHNGAICAVKAKNTIKQVGPGNFIEKTLDRSLLWEMQTPQIVPIPKLLEGFKISKENNIPVTDDAQLVELTGTSVKLVEGSNFNIKITTNEDLLFAEAILGKST